MTTTFFMRTAAVSVLAMTLGAMACGNLTDVPTPSNLLDGSQLTTQATAVSMYSGAVFAFSTAFAGSNGYDDESAAGVTGVFADEYTTNLNGTPALHDTHNATARDEVGQGPYERLQTARQTADAAIRSLVANGGTAPKSYIGELYAIKGYVYLMISEAYCEGSPFSSLATTGTVVYGTPQTREQMLTTAVTLFDSAAAFAADSGRILNLAAVGKGRAYLDLGDLASAKAAVTSVPTNFIYQLTYASSSYSNYVTPIATGWGSVFVTDREGGHGLDYVAASAVDPRMKTVAPAGLAIPAKFSAANAPVPLASGVEARLIEAEAALRDHDVPAWTTTLNTLRASGGATPIPALTADSTTTASDSVRLDVMFRERAFWTFGTAHRLGDMRRLVRQYQRTVTNVFPAGVQSLLPMPLVYVPVPVMEIPKTESDNNPLFHGCLNHNA